jgi:hypothetical protein
MASATIVFKEDDMNGETTMNDNAPLQRMKDYVDRFNREDNELYINYIPNSAAYQWMADHVPLIDIPDRELEAVYYFRWWTYRKHIKKTETGYIVDEFLPDVPWAGAYNSISCAAGHHLAEGRWLRNEPAIDAYIRYWYQESTNINSYTHWIDSALWDLCELRGDYSLGVEHLDRMAYWFRDREAKHFHRDTGLFWGTCNHDGQEFAVSGDGFRLPQNCYMAANAKAIADFARMAGRADLEEEFSAKHRAVSEKIETLLWSGKDRFYLNIHCPLEAGRDGAPLNLSAAAPDLERRDPRFKCRELWGYTPWYFGLAPSGREDAFELLADPACFYGAYGLTTADRRHSGYGCFYTGEELNAWLKARDQPAGGPKAHECLWNGPSWPFATSFALGGLAASLRADDGLFFKLLKQYAASHRLRPAEGDGSPFWIDEVQHPDTGDWIARTRLMHWSDNGGWDKGKGGEERGKDYNHSSFCDSVISGLFGLRVDEGKLMAKPLFPKDWEYAAIHHIPVRGALYTLRYQGGGVSIVVE